MKIEDLNVADERSVFINSSSGAFIPITSHKAIWNMNLDELAAITSSNYHLIQHAEVTRALVEALDNLNIKYTINIKQGGHRAYIDVVFSDMKFKLENFGEQFIGGLRLINSYDRSTGLMILPRVTRMACKNGMILTSYQMHSNIRHNSKEVLKFDLVIGKILHELVNLDSKLRKLVEESFADSIEWQLAENVLLTAIKTRKHIDLILEILKKNTKEQKITRWDLYNAVTEYATHNEQLRPHAEMWLQSKANKILESKSYSRILEIAKTL